MRSGPIGNDLDQCVAQEAGEEFARANLIAYRSFGRCPHMTTMGGVAFDLPEDVSDVRDGVLRFVRGAGCTADRAKPRPA